ncbi:MAG: acetyl-CoA acetyltransferase, partial [Mycobacterium sp.]
MPVDPRTPVLIGYGQVNQHEETNLEGKALEPVDLMEAAARQAAAAKVLGAVDTIRVVNLFSARYRDPGLLVGQRIGADHPGTYYSGVGGNMPQSLVNQACLDIWQGRAGVVLLAGGETWRSRTRLRARGSKLVWTHQGESVPLADSDDDGIRMAGAAE